MRATDGNKKQGLTVWDNADAALRDVSDNSIAKRLQSSACHARNYRTTQATANYIQSTT